MRAKATQILAVILVFAFAIRIGGLLTVYGRSSPASILQPDSLTYENPARALLELGRYARSPEAPDSPELVRPPGYPALIAGVYFVFGPRRAAVIVAQILISLGTIAVLYGLARRLWGERVGLLAAALLALDPVSWLYANLLLSETGFTFLVILLVDAGVRLLSAPSREMRWAFLAGLYLALATFFRPLAYYLVAPVFLGVMGVKLILRRPAGIALGQALLFLLPWAVLIGGWHCRNYLAAGRGAFSGGIERKHVYAYRAIDLLARRQGISHEEAEQRFLESLPEAKGLTGEQQARLLEEKAGELFPVGMFVRDSIHSMLMMFKPSGLGVRSFLDLREESGPAGDLLRLPLKDFARLWLIQNPGGFVFYIFDRVLLLTIYGGGILGVFYAWTADRKRWPIHLWLLGLIVYFVLLTAISGFGYDRFRAPIMPLLALYAALGILSKQVSPKSA